jgi:ABC-2 type transport system permease protein
MNPRRLWAIVRRVTQEIRRDRPSLALLFIAPILVTGLVTFIVRESGTPDVHAGIVAGSGAPGALIAGALRTALEADGMTVTDEPDEATARTAVADGGISLAILLPSDLANGRITLLTNGLDPSGEGAQIGAVQKALIGAAVGVAGAKLPSVAHEAVYGIPSSDPIISFAPAIVGFFAYFFVYVLTGVSFLRERTGGTLERLLATPVTRGEIVLGYTLGFGLFATAQVALLLAWTLGTVQVPAIGPLPAFAIGLGIQMAGSPLLAFLAVLLLAVGAVSLGIFLSTFARTELQIIQFIPIVLAPQFLLSGVLFPVSTLPSVLKPLVALMPLGYAVDALRQVFIRGADLSVGALQGDLLVLALVAVFFAVIASLTIRRDVV